VLVGTIFASRRRVSTFADDNDRSLRRPNPPTVASTWTCNGLTGKVGSGPKLPVSRASSDGRRNTCLKFTRGRSEIPGSFLDVDSSAARSGRAAVDVRQWVSPNPAEDFADELTALAEGAESGVALHFRRNRESEKS
jgi:hypothetical protein